MFALHRRVLTSTLQPLSCPHERRGVRRIGHIDAFVQTYTLKELTGSLAKADVSGVIGPSAGSDVHLALSCVTFEPTQRSPTTNIAYTTAPLRERLFFQTDSKPLGRLAHVVPRQPQSRSVILTSRATSALRPLNCPACFYDL
jgi:hypothetical protein